MLNLPNVSVSQCQFCFSSYPFECNIGKLYFSGMLIPGGRKKSLILSLRDKMAYAL